MEVWNEIGAVDASSVRQAVASILVAYLLSQAIGAVYAYTYRGLSYSRSYVQALVVGGIVAAMLMLAIGNSLARGIGIVGTLALIRFRTNLRDPLDMVFIFASFGAGIAAGTGNYVTGVVGTALFLIVVATLRITGFGAQRQYDGIIRLRLPAGEEPDVRLREILRAECVRFALVTMREVAQGREVELAYQVTMKKPDAETKLVHEIAALQGASDVSISMQEATVEL
jgi:uncharacterized membrane protein YhiD involved in acid resistance